MHHAIEYQCNILMNFERKQENGAGGSLTISVVCSVLALKETRTSQNF